MGRVRGIGIAGVIALTAIPSLALADSLERPAAGAWEPYGTADFVQSNVAFGSFTITAGGITGMTFVVTTSSESNAGCPTGSVSVSGALGLKLYKLSGTRPFYAFGRVVTDKALPGHKRFEDAPVTATLDGQPVKNAMLSIQFVPADTQGITGDSSGGEFDFNKKCQVTLSEDISQSENEGNS
jgi:hypothetical protein